MPSGSIAVSDCMVASAGTDIVRTGLNRAVSAEVLVILAVYTISSPGRMVPSARLAS